MNKKIRWILYIFILISVLNYSCSALKPYVKPVIEIIGKMADIDVDPPSFQPQYEDYPQEEYPAEETEYYEETEYVSEESMILLKGFAVDNYNKRLSKVTIGVLPLGETLISRDTLIAYSRTDMNGNFVLNRKIEQGSYTIKVVAEGYQTYWQDLDIYESQQKGLAFMKIVMVRE